MLSEGFAPEVNEQTAAGNIIQFEQNKELLIGKCEGLHCTLHVTKASQRALNGTCQKNLKYEDSSSVNRDQNTEA